MRLIDADAFLERFEAMCETRTDNVIAMVLRGVLVGEPTAYDVNKVVEQLGKESYQEWCDLPKIVELKDAIEIVKGGGVNE